MDNNRKEFKLSEKFLDQYEGKQPKWGFGDLSYFVYKRTYARLKEDGNQEEYFDTVKRVVEGCFQIQLDHCVKFGLPWDTVKAQKSAHTMFQKIWEFKFTPPGRGLWVMGTPVVDRVGSASLQNCAFISTKDIKKDLSFPFAWACDMLMLGVGVGFDARGADQVVIKGPKGSPIVYQIPDTREGWVESIRLLIDSYQGRNPIQFDYSNIRPAGSPIKGFGGTSSGAEPLKDGHKNLARILDKAVGDTLSSVHIVDMMNYIGKFVVSGNVRRSAEIALGDPSDKEYINMKDPKKFSKELLDRRWASNNSVLADTITDYTKIVEAISKNGEPGLIFMDNCQHYGRTIDGFHEEGSDKYDECIGVNPCAEINLQHGELCNLVECYPANHDTIDEYFDTLKYAYLYAKSVTLVKTHDPLANSVMLRNRRIGVSQSGIQQAISKFGHKTYFEKFCKEGYDEIRRWDKIYSRWLGIPTSIRVTTVKPSGTVSLLAGATPGVHCTHSEYYMRTIRVADNDKLLPKLKKAGYKIEVDKASPGTMVVYFPVKEKNFTKSKYDISLWEQMTLVRELQHYWADNAVSCTITFNTKEVKDLESAIKFFAPHVKTLSFLPLEDHNYEQAPYQTTTKDEYEKYCNTLKDLDLGASKNEALGERYCSNDTCSIL